MKPKKLLLIVNPVAGKIKISAAFFDIVKVFSDGGFSVNVHMTSRRGEAAEIAENMGGDYDIVVFCGGDGTLNEGVSGLLRGGHRTPIGYIPCGTTNDFAASLGLERENYKTAAENIVRGRTYSIDIGAFDSDRYFNYIASFGAFTDTSYNVPQTAKNILGHLAYVMEGLKTLPNIRSIHSKIKLDDVELEDDYLFAAISNTTSIGGLLKIDSEKVDFSDGVFEVMLVRYPRSALEISRAILAIQTGKYEDCCVEFYHTSKAVFEMDEAVSWALDGECGQAGKHVEITVLNQAVNIII